MENGKLLETDMIHLAIVQDPLYGLRAPDVNVVNCAGVTRIPPVLRSSPQSVEIYDSGTLSRFEMGGGEFVATRNEIDEHGILTHPFPSPPVAGDSRRSREDLSDGSFRVYNSLSLLLLQTKTSPTGRHLGGVLTRVHKFFTYGLTSELFIVISCVYNS